MQFTNARDSRSRWSDKALPASKSEIDDGNSTRISKYCCPASADDEPKHPSLRSGSDDAMSNLRVVNTAPGEEQLPYFATIHTKYDDRLDSLISTPNSSPTPYSRPESPFGRVLERDDERYIAEPTDPLSFVDSFNLEPPPPGYILNSLEVLTERLFSADHLDTILSDQLAAIRFTGFLDTYLPHFLPLLRQYSEAAKAAKAVDYANAIVRQIGFQSDHSIDHAAKLDDQFQAKKNQLVRELVDRALPAHLTQQLVSLVTDTMVKEITGNSAPVVRTLIPSLAEVYCISDPSLPDNPVVYASEGEAPQCDWNERGALLMYKQQSSTIPLCTIARRSLVAIADFCKAQ